MTNRQTVLTVVAAAAAIAALIVPRAFSHTAPNPPPQAVLAQDAMPMFRVMVVGRTTAAVNYRPRRGDTKIDFAGTTLMPQAKGSATVSGEQGYIKIKASFDKRSEERRV